MMVYMKNSSILQSLKWQLKYNFIFSISCVLPVQGAQHIQSAHKNLTGKCYEVYDFFQIVEFFMINEGQEKKRKILELAGKRVYSLEN